MNKLSETKLRGWLLFGGLLVIVVGLVAGSIATGAFQSDRSPSAAAPSSSEAANYAKGLSKAFREAAEQALPSVVMLYGRPVMRERSSTLTPKQDEEGDDSPFGDLFRQHPDLRRFFQDVPRGLPRAPRREVYGAGAGVIIDSSGVILTNNHVVQGDGKLMVRLMDGREIEAVEVKTDRQTDLAIVRIKGAGNLKAAKLGDSDKLAVGDWVLALGNPFGLEGTVTAGIISAKGRGIGIARRAEFLQTDAAINPGNSGGPLVNLDGEVVGLNTAISSDTGANMGVGFAVPINMAKWVADQLARGGEVQRARLGVGIQAIPQSLADQFGVKVREGVLVTEVFPDSPGAAAGLKPGDVIVKYAGQPIPTAQDLQGLVERGKIGRKESIEVIRDGKRMTFSVTLDKQPADYGITARGPARSFTKPEGSRFDKLGIEVGSLSPDVAGQLGMKSAEGVLITQVRAGSLADIAGLESGTVIIQANHKPVKTAEDLRKALESQPLDKGVLLLVRTADGTRFLVVRADKE